jgi:hypothetical protein
MSYSYGNGYDAYGQQQQFQQGYGFNAGYSQAAHATGHNVSLSQTAAQNTSNNRSNLGFQSNGAAEEFSSFNGHVASQGVSSTVNNSTEYAAQQRYRSDIEQQILRAQQPVQINESEEITVNGERGLWANKAEVINWRGVIPIEQYTINQDNNPEIITKRSNQHLEVCQYSPCLTKKIKLYTYSKNCFI